MKTWSSPEEARSPEGGGCTRISAVPVEWTAAFRDSVCGKQEWGRQGTEEKCPMQKRL